MNRKRIDRISTSQPTKPPRRGSLWHSLFLGVAIVTFAVTALLLFGPLIWPGS